MFVICSSHLTQVPLPTNIIRPHHRPLSSTHGITFHIVSHTMCLPTGEKRFDSIQNSFSGIDFFFRYRRRQEIYTRITTTTTTIMIFNRNNVLLLALGLLAVLSPHPAAAVSKKAGGRRTRSEDAAERRRLLEEREEAFAAANPYSVIDQDHRRAGSGSGGALFYSGSGTGSGTGKGKGSSKCGLPGERCCADPSHRCLPGFGCKFPDDFMMIEEDELAYTCQKCGGTGQPCCNIGCGEDSCESTCMAGNTCDLFQNKCTACGGVTQPCCPDDVCSAGSTCDPINKVCDACGAQGQPCCAGDVCSLQVPTLACDKLDTGLCEVCGGVGQVCCPGNECTSNGGLLTCNEAINTCESCGGEGQQCCPGDVCNGNDLSCDATTGLCQDCGASNELCCPGFKCPDGTSGGGELTCGTSLVPPKCQACGGAGEPCCLPKDGYDLPCPKMGDSISCLEGNCPDIVPDGTCLLGNGKGPASDVFPAKGCNQSTDSNSATAKLANDALCCGKNGSGGSCEQPKTSTNGDGSFMWCVAN